MRQCSGTAAANVAPQWRCGPAVARRRRRSPRQKISCCGHWSVSHSYSVCCRRDCRRCGRSVGDLGTRHAFLSGKKIQDFVNSRDRSRGLFIRSYMPCQFIQRYIENMVKNNNKYITNIASYTGRPGHRAGLEGVTTVTWGSNPEIRNAILYHPNPVPSFNMCSAESALRLNSRPATWPGRKQELPANARPQRRSPARAGLISTLSS